MPEFFGGTWPVANWIAWSHLTPRIGYACMLQTCCPLPPNETVRSCLVGAFGKVCQAHWGRLRADGNIGQFYNSKETRVMKVIPADRKSSVLARSSLACLSNLASINLTSGCAHRCVYCYTRGYNTYPGQRAIRLYVNTAAKLRDELARRRRPPRAVYFSPSSDLFQPVPEVLDLAWEVLKLLFDKRIPVAFLTKGAIPSRHMRLLAKHAPLVCAQVGLITLDEKLRRAFEPNTAPGAVRLAQARELAAAGIPTSGRLDPILPGLTDDLDTFQAVCSGFKKAGVASLAAGILFLRPAVSHSIRRNLNSEPVQERLLAAFHGAARLRIHAESSSVTALPPEARLAIFERLLGIAAGYGIEVNLCGCKNPDITRSCCNIAGHWPGSNTAGPQPALCELE